MRKQEARDIALILIAKSGENFDMFAFDDYDLSYDDENKIIKEIQAECDKIITRLQKKYNVVFKDSTEEIVEQILYE